MLSFSYRILYLMCTLRPVSEIRRLLVYQPHFINKWKSGGVGRLPGVWLPLVFSSLHWVLSYSAKCSWFLIDPNKSYLLFNFIFEVRESILYSVSSLALSQTSHAPIKKKSRWDNCLLASSQLFIHSLIFLWRVTLDLPDHSWLCSLDSLPISAYTAY